MSRPGNEAKSKRPAKPEPELNAVVLRKAVVRRLPRRLAGSGQVRLPAMPSQVEEYVQRLQAIFTALGRTFDDDDLAKLRRMLEGKLQAAFEESPYARVLVSYETNPPPKVSLTYRMSVQVSTIADEYAEWVANRTAPLFGAHPDAKVMALAHGLGAPAEVPVLDVGAGTGRNTLPLARAGFPTDAIELAPALANILRDDVAKEGLADRVRVFEGDALDAALGVPLAHYRLVVLAEVIASHARSVSKVGAMLRRMTELLAPDGVLLFSAFITRSGYTPSPEVREAGEIFWSCLFSRNDLATATLGLELKPLSDESVYDFEHEHLPAEAWPPTGWFAEWVNGLDAVDVPLGRAPFELRWLAYRRHS
jgi:2-polyprenyl-3-methyl-5-hydroxy-6-metoxy-1,4-benzoquinol methylase